MGMKKLWKYVVFTLLTVSLSLMFWLSSAPNERRIQLHQQFPRDRLFASPTVSDKNERGPSFNCTVRPQILVVYSKLSELQSLKKFYKQFKLSVVVYYVYSRQALRLYSYTESDMECSASYALVAFASIQTLLHMESDIFEDILTYCRHVNATIVISASKVASPDHRMTFTKRWSTAVKDKSSSKKALFWINFASLDKVDPLKESFGYILNVTSNKFLVATKPGSTVYTSLSTLQQGTLMFSNHPTFLPLATIRLLRNQTSLNNSVMSYEFSTVLCDKGLIDGVQKLIVGGEMDTFPTSLLVYDWLLSCSPTNLFPFDPLKRFITIDVDDTFMGREGTRLSERHVKNVLNFQKVSRNIVSNFHLNLGFVGSGFDQGNLEEVKGNHLLLQHKDDFWWFPHTYSHINCVKRKSIDEVMDNLKKNKEFAERVGILDKFTGYAVAPFHSGIYPAYDRLYEAWSEVWGITVTTTTEYRHSYPQLDRKGFIYKGIKVLPRHNCGIYSMHTYLADVDGNKLLNSGQGGLVFHAVLFNPITFFMTHFNNYGGDQLAMLLFNELFQFINRWTNFKLVQESANTLSELYFSWYPDERFPLWTNPCSERIPENIKDTTVNCTNLPSLLIVGPQKTGSTALHFFLQAHPLLKANYPGENFEEVQFFSNHKLYLKGVEWYMRQFPYYSSEVILFEKSATYFNSQFAPQRASALLPHAKIIIILQNPIYRAYSWYQHVKVHKDPIAMRMKFEDIVQYSGSNKSMNALKDHCIKPGLYFELIQRWLLRYSPKQLYLVDGDVLKNNPVLELTKIQHFLGFNVKTFFDFGQHIKFSVQKGYYCRLVKDKLQCLGSGKGRPYAPMTDMTYQFLYNYYKPHNKNLVSLLQLHNFSLPTWLV